MIKSLKITDSKALELYKTASTELKEILEETFGLDFFKPKDITETVYDLDTLAEHLEMDTDDLYIYKKPKNAFEKYLNACAIIPKIVEVYNQGTILDWNNTSEYKYLPYIRKIGLAWVADYSVSWGSFTDGPVAHHYKSNNLALKGINNFNQIYLDYLTYKG